tara:strand:+ start:610 stop:1044 length:435 start_codon:yes stop_codon:yes gene_type:complete
MEEIIERLSNAYQQKIDIVGKQNTFVDVLEENVHHTNITYVKQKWERILEPLYHYTTFTSQNKVLWAYKISYDKRICVLENSKNKHTLMVCKEYQTVRGNKVFYIQEIQKNQLTGYLKIKNNYKQIPINIVLNYKDIPHFLALV